MQVGTYLHVGWHGGGMACCNHFVAFWEDGVGGTCSPEPQRFCPDQAADATRAQSGGGPSCSKGFTAADISTGLVSH